MANEDRVVATSSERIDPVVPMTAREFVGILLIGAIVGIVSYGAYYLLHRYVFESAMCLAGQDTNSCQQAPTYAMIVAMVIGAIVALTLLVRARIYRPLLVVVGATIAAWSFNSLFVDVAWYILLIATVILFALCYGLFAWIARLRSFVVAVIVTVVLAAAIRFVAMS